MVEIARVQAEDGVKSGDADNDTVVRNAANPETGTFSGLRPNYTGTGYVDFGNDASDTMTYTVEVATAGTYVLHVRYATSSNRPMDVILNGGAAQRVAFDSTDPDGTGPLDGFNYWQVVTVTVQLAAGTNTIALKATGMGPNIDALAITTVGDTVDFMAEPDAAATSLSLTAVPVAENAAGAILADIAIADADTSYTAADFTLSDPVNYRVIEVDGALKLALAEGVSLDFEGAQPPVTVSAGGLQQSFTPAPADVNEAPVLTGTVADASFVAGTGGSVSLSGLTATDPDAGDSAVLVATLADGSALPEGFALDGAALQVARTVAPGTYQISFKANDGELDSNIAPLTVTVAAPQPAFVQILQQAESGVTITNDGNNNTAVRTADNKESNPNLPTGLRPDFTGTGYVDMGGEADRVTYQVTIAEAGSYDLHVRYATNTDRPMSLAVNGAALGDMAFTETDPNLSSVAPEGFDTWEVKKVTIQLNAGVNTISFANKNALGPNLDAFAITLVGGTPDFAIPAITSSAVGTAAENTSGVVLDVNASDAGGRTLTYSLTGNGADDALFDIDAATGAVSFKTAPDFEAPADQGADNVYNVQVAVSNGQNSTTQALTLTVGDVVEVVNQPAVIDTAILSADENQLAAGVIAASDADNDPLTFSLAPVSEGNDNALFTLGSDGTLSFLTAPDFEALGADTSFSVDVQVSDGVAVTTKTITVNVQDVVENGPRSVNLAGELTSYTSQDRPQDGGTGVAATADSLSLDGNLWKRLALDSDYVITADTQLVVNVRVGTGAETPEIVAIGFDLNDNPFDADASIFQLGGTQTQGGFVDLRGTGTPNADGTTSFVIDLGAHAGKTLGSLVVINDDDSLASLGSSAFSNVQLIEDDSNAAPVVVGGGIADRTLKETGALEIDLPFSDADGDTLTYALEIRDSAGALVENVGNLAIVDGVLSGDVATLGAGVFQVKVVASDGAATVQDEFTLTVEQTNRAPVAADVALEPYFGQVGSAFAGFDVDNLASFFSDLDGDALTLTVEGLPEGLTIDENGVISGEPAVTGTFEVKVRATDPSGLSDTLALQFVIEGPALGQPVTIEAEAFTGLATADGFFATGSSAASDQKLILLNGGDSGSISTQLGANGVAAGTYRVTVYVFDETDGAGTFSLSIDGVPLQVNGSPTIVLNDGGPGSFVDANAPRGNAAQAGNIKAITFDSPVAIGPDTVATLTAQSLGGELMRIDRLVFTPVAEVNDAPADVALTGSVDENAAGALVGILSATDAEGDAVTFTTSDARFVVAINDQTGAAELRLAPGVSLDRETDNGTSVTVTATDAKGAATTTSLVLNVNDLNEAPVLAANTLADQAFAEGAGGTIDLSLLGSADPDAGDTATYAVRLAGGGALPDGLTLNGSTLSVDPALAAGSYAVEVFATDGELDSESVSFTVTVAAAEPEQPFTLVLQAEAGTLTILDTDTNTNDTAVRDPSNPETGTNPALVDGLRPGFTGTGYLDFGDTAGDKVTHNFEVPAAGTYDINVRYATNTDRPLAFVLNGAAPVQLPFVATGTTTQGPTEGFNNWAIQTVRVELAAGSNTISFAIPAGANTGPNLDSVEITRVLTAPADTSADEDGNLFLSGPDGVLTGAAKESINFTISGRDEDIAKVEISFDGGTTRTTVLPDADGDFVVDGSSLAAGNYQAVVYVTDDAGNVASKSMPIEIGAATVAPITIQAEDETLVAVQDSGTGPTDTSLTREVNALAPDAFGNFRAGAIGDAYIDFGTNPGDAITFNVDAPAAGTYTVTFRYANGATANRPLDLVLNGGDPVSVDFVPGPVTGTGTTATAWESWVETSVEVTLAAGANTIQLAIPAGAVNGPNIDQATFTFTDTGPVDPREQIAFEEVVKINFEPSANQGSFSVPAGYVTPAGFLADTGAAYGDRGNGFTYGWVDVENNLVTSTPLGQPFGSMRYKNDVPGASDLQKTYAHFEYPGASAATNERAFELALPNGTYEVTLSIGDTGGAYDSNNVINVEGASFFPGFTPVNLSGQSPTGSAYNSSDDGKGFRSSLVTGIVTVTDGKLTIDSIGGYNTEIQFLEVERVPDITPNDGRTADKDFSFFVAPVAATLDGQTSIAIGPNGELPMDIDPSAQFVVGVNLQADGNRGPNIGFIDGIKLVETLTGQEVAINVQISGGADSLTITPLEQLKDNTSYTLKVEDVMDLGSVEDTDGALRQFQDLTTTFVTGVAEADVPREVAFSTETLLDGFADNAFGFTTVEFGPDGKLYVATITGEIHRWDVNADGTIDKDSQETLALDYLATENGDRRGIIGFVFDPTDPNTIFITDNAPIPRESKAFETPEFSGRISKITLGEGGSFTGATAEAYITGLPRSGGDHLTNSLEFRANPDAGQPGEPAYLLYLTQGSNSAAGQADGAWGNRPERLLNAAVLEVDPTRDAPPGGFDVRTEPVSATDAPTTTFPAGNFNPDGTYPGMYNPFAEDAVLKIYATGVRNAYDLVWHSNGNLYIPTNGTASGGRTPTDPTQPGLDTTIGNSPKQYDYFFTVDEGGYYGHPNPLLDNYILNGGNPTSGLDPNEVVGGNDGNSNTDGYQVGVNPDADYDLDGVYNLGYNRSPNGATEYTGNAFGSNLKGAILFAQFSTGDNVRAIRVDADGKIIGDDVLRRPDGSVINNYIDPLDIIENPVTGQLYLMTLNRGTGASQLVLLTPAPGGVTADLDADEGNNLAVVAFDVSDPSASVFEVNGLDGDITAVRVSFNNGPATTVTLDAQNRFTVDLGGLSGPVTATVQVTDDALNQASASTVFTPGQEPPAGEYQTLVTIQAEDKLPTDGTSVTVPAPTTTGIQIRDASNIETGTGPGYVNGLRPGAFGIDGNTDNLDGTPGGYADFGTTNADFITFNFNAEDAGPAILKFRYANGGAADRPLQVEVNGTVVKVQAFVPTTSSSTSDGWTEWGVVEVPASLLAGANTVTLRSVSNIGPNIDQLEVLVPTDTGTETPNDGETVINGVTYVLYEAENAASTGAPGIVTEERNQSGSAFVDFVGPDTETVTWTVEVAEAGTYGLDILYALAAGKTARPMGLSVDGQPVGTLAFAPNSNTAETTWGPESTTLQLSAGVHTITVTAPDGVGPNLDLLRISKAPVSLFEPDPAEIDGSGRIELEATDGSARTVSGSAVEFFFNVADDGVYKIDTAANANAANGQGLSWFLNGVEVDDTAFPGAGAVGEQSVFLQLEAGTNYTLRIVSDAPGASGLDYLDVSPAPGNPNADITVQSLDPAFFDNRLHFSFIENPDAVTPGADRDFKDSGTVRITNSGTEALTFTSTELSGPFKLANPDAFTGLSIAAGQSVDIEVLFDRSKYSPPTSNVDSTSTVFQGALKLITNDADNPITTVDLAGFWQARDEGGQEPNVNEAWKVFGFGNVIEGLKLTGGGENSVLSTKDVFAKTDETEVLSPYWQIAEGYTSAKITHIAAFHGPGGASVGIHNPGNKGSGITFWNHEGNDNQRFLPNEGNDATFATETFTRGTIPDAWAGNEVFGITVAGLSTDPRLNPVGGEVVPGAQQGHTVKMFQALDAQGNVIPNVYLGVMDYTGINYDYNDNMFVIEGVQPVGFGQTMKVAGLDDAAADDRLVFTNIDEPASTTQVFRNEATFTITNDGFAPLAISSIAVGDPSAFEIVGTPPASIAAGASAQVTVRFIGDHTGTDSGAELYKSTLTINSNAFTDGAKVIQLAGLAQEFSENGSEPTVAQIVEAFGYSTDVAQGELAGGGVVETIGDEVLLPYLERLDDSKPVEVIQLAAFLNQGNVARLGFHGLDSAQVTNLFANDDQQGQTILPDQLVAGPGSGATVARGVINSSDPFGIYISVDGRPTYSSWSDPEANKIDPEFGQLVGEDQGHLIRYFQALDAAGNPIEGTFIGIQDYPGAGNYDYNDHMFVIRNVKAAELTGAQDSNNNDVNDALETDTDGDGTVNFFDADNTPPVEPGEKGEFVLGVNFGGGAIAMDPVLGVPLVAQSDPRVVITGSVNPGAGVDDASNLNGANATAGSAFKTYEDGANWTANISVPNGTYVVVLHTQETYWNSAGQRQFDAFVNGEQVINNLDPFAAAGGGDKPIAVEAVVTVTNGVISINMDADIDNAALNAVTIYKQPTTTPPTGQQPFLGQPFVVDADGVTIDASNYDNGGQGIAYNDAAGLQGGTNGGRTGSDVEATGAGDIGWIGAGDWLEYSINVQAAGQYDLDMLMSNGTAGGATARIDFYRAGESTPYATTGSIANPSTGSWATFVNRAVDGITLDAGQQIARVTFTSAGQDFRSFALAPSTPAPPPPPVQTPFSGTAASVGVTAAPVTIQATTFDNGGQGIAFNDTTATDQGGSQGRNTGVDIVGNNSAIGWISDGEWVEYTVNVAQAGAYTLSFAAASPLAGRTITASFEQGGLVYATAAAANVVDTDNYTSFTATSPVTVNLQAGEQVIRLAFNGGAFDLQSFTLDRNDPVSAQNPFGGTAPVIGATTAAVVVNATAFDTGGQGVAYNDTSPQDEGGSQGRNEGVDVVGNNQRVGWVDGGEWIEYTVNVAQAGTYNLTFSAATPEGGRTIGATFAKDGIVYATAPTAAVLDTNSWSSFASTQAVSVQLEAGTQVIRLSFAGGNSDLLDLNSFSLQRVGAATNQLFGVEPVSGGELGTADAIDQLLQFQDSLFASEFAHRMFEMPGWIRGEHDMILPHGLGVQSPAQPMDEFAGSRWNGEVIDPLGTYGSRDRRAELEGEMKARYLDFADFDPTAPLGPDKDDPLHRRPDESDFLF